MKVTETDDVVLSFPQKVPFGFGMELESSRATRAERMEIVFTGRIGKGTTSNRV